MRAHERAPWYLRDCAGQGTVEFAVITAALLVMVVAGNAVWQAFGSGLLVEHALSSASHHVLSGVEVMADVFSF